MTTTLAAHALETIRQHGADTFPDECCGALIVVDDVVVEAVRMENTTTDGAARRFRIAPDAYLVAERRARDRGRPYSRTRAIPVDRSTLARAEIGRASCRERVCSTV